MSKEVKSHLDAMTLEQKVGQMLCYGFCGCYPHRDIVRAIEKYHVAGFRVTPHGRKFQRYFGEDLHGLLPTRRQSACTVPISSLHKRRRQPKNAYSPLTIHHGSGTDLHGPAA